MTGVTIRTAWTFGGAAVVDRVVRIRQVNPDRQDQTVGPFDAFHCQSPAWTPVVGECYYVQLFGHAPLPMTWWFVPAEASPRYAISLRIIG